MATTSKVAGQRHLVGRSCSPRTSATGARRTRRQFEGYEQLAEFWTADEGAIFTTSAEPVAVEGDVAVVRVLVNYGGDQPQEYSDLWVMHFAADGRVDDFEE